MQNTSPGRGLLWRPLQPGDLAAVAALTAACLESDGGLPLAATPDFIRDRYLSAPSTLAGWDADGGLAACAAVQISETPQEHRALIAGQVHPAYRRRGLGAQLIEWSVAQARVLLSPCAADRPHAICIASESLAELAERLYARHGFAQEFGEIVMRRDLAAPLPDSSLPPGVTLATWAPECAAQFFEAYHTSFRERPGFPGWSAEQWIAWVSEDDSFLPDLSLLASRNEQPIGFVVCAQDWIEQIGVRPEERGRGLASALIGEVLWRFKMAGTSQVWLTVNVNNPGAERVYARLGFEVAGRRGRFTRREAIGTRQ